MRWGPHRWLSLKAMMRRSVRLASRPGLWWGRLERSSMGWPARYRPTHRLTVAGETWKRSAARRTGQPSSTTRRARRRRPSGVNGALAWVMKASGQRCECVNPHPAGGLHTTSPLFTTSQESATSTSSQSKSFRDMQRPKSIDNITQNERSHTFCQSYPRVRANKFPSLSRSAPPLASIIISKCAPCPCMSKYIWNKVRKRLVSETPIV